MNPKTKWAALICLVGVARATAACAEPNLPGEDEPEGQDAPSSGTAKPLPAVTNTTNAPSPTPVTPDGGSASDGAAGDGSTTCTKTLNIASTNATCALGYLGGVQTSVAQAGPVKITYPCAGGAVSAKIGAQTFTGTVNGMRIQLTTGGQFQTQEARGRGVFATCTVKSHEEISGDLASGTLSYAYREQLVSGVCYFAGRCTASATVTVAP